jgi:hypothetical protein
MRALYNPGVSRVLDLREFVRLAKSVGMHPKAARALYAINRVR